MCSAVIAWRLWGLNKLDNFGSIGFARGAPTDNTYTQSGLEMKSKVSSDPPVEPDVFKTCHLIRHSGSERVCLCALNTSLIHVGNRRVAKWIICWYIFHFSFNVSLKCYFILFGHPFVCGCTDFIHISCAQLSHLVIKCHANGSFFIRTKGFTLPHGFHSICHWYRFYCCIRHNGYMVNFLLDVCNMSSRAAWYIHSSVVAEKWAGSLLDG